MGETRGQVRIENNSPEGVEHIKQINPVSLWYKIAIFAILIETIQKLIGKPGNGV
ncbi:MAG: hypothetical protein WCJ95_20585 [Mariniphaga sp.]